MNKHIRLLDCTLRDGCHINDGRFGRTVITNVIRDLIAAKLDIIEIGFLWDKPCDVDTAHYYTINDVKRVLPNKRGESMFSLMADYIDLTHIEPYDGTIEYIRLSFKRHRWKWAIKTARILMDKGYKVFINPVNCNVYSDEEYIAALKTVNELKPYGFSIVDTFGTLRKHDLTRIFSLVDHNLDNEIAVGLHLHENLGLAYSLAQHYLEISNPLRDVIIDCSLLGMGRIPGNLCSEQIMDHLNNEYNSGYDTAPALDAIDDYIAPIKREKQWGYAIPYALSAKYNLHRTYAEFLMEKKRLKTKDIQRILSNVCKDEAELFNEKYIEKLYEEYMNVKIDSTPTIKTIKNICEKRKVLVLAPGKSISTHIEQIYQFINREHPVIFAVNFIPPKIKADIIFCSNVRRLDNIKYKRTHEHLLITSNLLDHVNTYDYVVSYNDVAYCAETHCDDSTVMLMNLLKTCGIISIYIAGFDGPTNGKFTFYDSDFEKNSIEIVSTDNIKKALNENYYGMSIELITPSKYELYISNLKP